MIVEADLEITKQNIKGTIRQARPRKTAPLATQLGEKRRRSTGRKPFAGGTSDILAF